MADVWLTFGISAGTPSIPNNTTPVTVDVYANWNYNYYNLNNKAGTLTIDGTPYSFAAPFNTGRTQNGGSQKLFSKAVNVKHGDDGKKTLTVSASYATGVVGTVSASTSKKLTTIPRVSDLSVNKTSVPADGKTTVIATATKKSTSFTDVLTVSLGSYSKTITSGTAFTIPMEWNNAITGTSAKATVKVETFSGDDSIGTDTAELTITVPDSVVPTINDADITEAVSSVTNAFGNRFVQNLSQLNVDVDASGAYGSTIRSYSISLDGVNYIQQAFTSNVLKTAGTLDVKVKITDSRGRTAEDTFTVDVVEYEKPAIISMVYAHCDADGSPNSNGTSTKVTIAGKVSSVGGQNTKALKLKYKSMADASYTERVVTISDWTFSVDVIVNNTDPTVTYEYVAELTDKINASTPETFRVTTGVPVLSRLAGGGGLTLFGEAEEEGFIIKGDNPMKFTSDEARVGSRQHLNFMGSNIITSHTNDTVDFWKAKGTGCVRFSNNYLIDQPAQYGMLFNITNGSDVKQMFLGLAGGSVFHRSGNQSGWNHSWRKMLDETNGIQIKKLWGNASPTSQLPAQTVTLTDQIENYGYWFATFKYWNTHISIKASGFFPVGQTASIDSSYDYNQSRTISISGNKASIGQNDRNLNWGSTSLDHNNAGMIIVDIYGVKGV